MGGRLYQAWDYLKYGHILDRAAGPVLYVQHDSELRHASALAQLEDLLADNQSASQQVIGHCNEQGNDRKHDKQRDIAPLHLKHNALARVDVKYPVQPPAV